MKMNEEKCRDYVHYYIKFAIKSTNSCMSAKGGLKEFNN